MKEFYNTMVDPKYSMLVLIWAIYTIPVYLVTPKTRRRWVASIKGTYNWAWAMFWLIVSPAYPLITLIWAVCILLRAFHKSFVAYRESTSFKEPPKWM